MCDFDPLEKRQQHSLDAALCGFESHGRRVTLLDTPGLPDFVGRSVSVLAAVEAVAVVVNAATGVEPMTTRMMNEARERGLCRFVVVNRIDVQDAHPQAVLEQLREAFGRECLPLNLPAEHGRAVVDCYFQSGGAGTDFGSVASAHEAIVDQVVEVDEALMTQHLEQSGSVTLEQLHGLLKQQPARVREAQRTASALDQRYAKLVLELLDLPAQWRLGNMQHLSRACEVALARHRRKVSELTQLQTIPPRYGSDQFSLGLTAAEARCSSRQREANMARAETPRRKQMRDTIRQTLDSAVEDSAKRGDL